MRKFETQGVAVAHTVCSGWHRVSALEPVPAEPVFAPLHLRAGFLTQESGTSKYVQCDKDAASLKRNRRTSGRIPLGRYFKSTRTDGVLSAGEFRLIEFYDSFTWRGLLSTCGGIPGHLFGCLKGAGQKIRINTRGCTLIYIHLTRVFMREHCGRRRSALTAVLFDECRDS